MPVELYRHYNAEGVLLYVGVSLKAIFRLRQHQRRSHWSDDIAKMTIERYATHHEATLAEIYAIITERPLFNKQHARSYTARAASEPIDLVELGLAEEPETEELALRLSRPLIQWIDEYAQEHLIDRAAAARELLWEGLEKPPKRKSNVAA